MTDVNGQSPGRSATGRKLCLVLLLLVLVPAPVQADSFHIDESIQPAYPARLQGANYTTAGQAPDSVDTSHGDEMVRAYLADQVRQIQSGWLASIADLEDWKSQRLDRRQELLRMVGLDPMPERTDLKAVVTGRLEHEAFTVEKLHFQSMPGLYVTANLYVPKERDGPLPGVLYVCGHANETENGVSFGSKTAYQHHPAWYARHGYVALIIDTYQLGEIEGIHHGTYREDRWWWWNRGYTPLGVETWNGIRALDYLASRPEVDAERLAVTGRSGGGIYSWLVTAVDDRVAASVPTAGITDLTDYVIDEVVTGHCDCMFMLNSRRWDFPMIPALAAPRPILLANGDVDPIFPLDGVLRVVDRARQVYALYGRMDRFEHLIVEAAHADTPPLQQETFRWMHRQLKEREPREFDSAEKLFDPAQLKVFEELPEDEINTRVDEVFVPAAPVPDVPGDRSSWTRLRDGWMEDLRAETFAGWPPSGAPLRARPADTVKADGLRIRAIDFDSQTPVRLRLWIAELQDVTQPDSLLVSALDESAWQNWLSIVRAAAGEEAASLIGPGADATPWPERDDEGLAALKERLRRDNAALAVVAPRGVGPTTWTETERGYGIRRSFMLVGQTVESMQIWDLRRALMLLRSDSSWNGAPVTLESRGTMAGLALYAAMFEPGVAVLNLYDLPTSHRQGPILLNVRRILDMPQAVAAALESVDVVHLIHTKRSSARRWAWPLETAAHASGSLRQARGVPWLVGSSSPASARE